MIKKVLFTTSLLGIATTLFAQQGDGPQLIIRADDMGAFHSTNMACMESALNGRGIRNLVREGCPIVKSFSDFLRDPRYISFPSSKGKYGIMGERFGIMDMERYEK